MKPRLDGTSSCLHPQGSLGKKLSRSNFGEEI